MSEFAVLRSTAEWAARYEGSRRKTVLSVGNFDGRHLGHQRILRRVRECASAMDALAAVVTFDPHPLKVLRPGQAPQLAETLTQRLEGFASFGLDAALVLHFDHALAALSPQDFARGILLDQLHAAAILVGQNFRFGHRQEGNVARLQEMAAKFGFSVEIVEPVTISGIVVSSTAVRNAVAEGRAADAARLLGRPFVLTGKIHRGEGRGSTVLFPTLNLAPEQELLPKTGVYATETEVGGKLYRSATNVGFRPTFGGTGLSIESHLFAFAEKLTDGRMEVRFWDRLRDERKFSGAEELRSQIAVDLERTRDFFRQLDDSPTIPQRA